MKHYGKENIKVHYVHADDDVRLARAKARGSFSMEVWNERLKDDAKYTEERIAELKDLLGEHFIFVENN